jgi:hypothetical protein
MISAYFYRRPEFFEEYGDAGKMRLSLIRPDEPLKI